MIKLELEWREVLWWMQGGMSSSQWSVYEDMVNRVWPQCSEQDRRNIWLIMRRDLGSWWRPDGWSGFSLHNAHGEGEWKPEGEIFDRTPWMYFRQVLARFDPENQFAVTLPVKDEDSLKLTLTRLWESVIDAPKRYVAHHGREFSEAFDIKSHPYLTVRAYGWHDPNGNDAYFVDWIRRCDQGSIMKAERMEIPDTEVM